MLYFKKKYDIRKIYDLYLCRQLTVGQLIYKIKRYNFNKPIVKSIVIYDKNIRIAAATSFHNNDPLYWMGNPRYLWSMIVEYATYEYRNDNTITIRLYVKDPREGEHATLATMLQQLQPMII